MERTLLSAAFDLDLGFDLDFASDLDLDFGHSKIGLFAILEWGCWTIYNSLISRMPHPLHFTGGPL